MYQIIYSLTRLRSIQIMISAPRRLSPLRSLVATTLAVATLSFSVDALPPSSTPPFLEVDLGFVHFNGMTGDFHFPEMTGQGGAFFDFDGDGDLDIYLVQGAMLDPTKKPSEAIFPYRETNSPRDLLLRNDGQATANGKAHIHFTDITEESGLLSTGYGIGVTSGDYDNDGWIDLYITNFGANLMLHNNGNGTFSDVTKKAKVEDSAWSSSSTFFDFDRDGWLDLYVTNYVQYSVAKNVECFAKSSRRDYCGPSGFQPIRDRLFRNLGNGTFEDISSKAGLVRQAGAGLGVVAADFNGDDWPDLYVANDGQPNFLFLNQKDGTFRDDALFAGVAVNREGKPEASMGVVAADHDQDGDLDLFLAHLTAETNTLFVNDGSGLFEDRTIESGLSAPSLPFTSFGTAWLDYDNDGWLDLVVLNGAVRILEPLARKGDPYPLAQTNQLFHGLGHGRYEDATAQAGPAFHRAEVSRGAAIGDIDNDGDTDILVLNNSGPARLLLNTVGHKQSWLGLRLITGKARRDALGARARFVSKSGATITRRVTADGSYGSAQDPRILLGLGAGKKFQKLKVTWPDGQEETFPVPPAGRYTTLLQGTSPLEKKTPKEASP